MKLEKDNVECIFRNWAKPKLFNVEGLGVRGWQCSACKRIEYSDDINEILRIKKL